MVRQLGRMLWDELGRRLGSLAAVTLLFVMGVGLGAWAVNALSPPQEAELIRYMDLFYAGLRASDPAGAELTHLERAISQHLQIAGMIWLAGATILGIPFVLLIIFLRGFTVGFTAAFLFLQKGWAGALFALVSLVPQNLLAVPALILVGAAALTFSGGLLRSRLSRQEGHFTREFLRYTGFVAAASLLLLLAAVLETYVTPVFMRLTVGAL